MLPSILTALSGAAWLHLNATDGCTLFRRRFWLDRLPEEANTAFVAAGYAEVWINGDKADESAVLEPGWSQWDERLLVPEYNVTAKLRKGWNVVGFILGAGWYGHLGNVPAAKFVLRYTLEKNQTSSIVTDDKWMMSQCPILRNDIYDGEVYDARFENPGWSHPDARDATRWTKVAPGGSPNQTSTASMSIQSMSPVRALNLLKPEFVTRKASGAIILDFGQNIAGWVRLSLEECAEGSVVTVRHAEFLIENRSDLYVGNLRRARAIDVYTCRGGAAQHEPRFTYHGFRFAEVLIDGNAKWSWSEQYARVVHSDVQKRGWLEMGNDVLTSIQAAIRRTQLDNLHSLPTDCPQRDERQGWMADASVSAEQALLNFDMQSFYVNWLQTIVDTQRSNSFHDCKIPVAGGGINGTCYGAVTDTSPHVPGLFGHRPADPSWGAALPILVDLCKRYYGDAIVQPFIAPVHAWADFLLSMRQDGIVKYHSYGDWLQPGKVASDPVVSEMSAAFSSILALYVASTLGDNTSRSRYTMGFEAMRKAFQKTYWNRTLSAFGDGSQASQVFALYFGGLPDIQEQASLKCLLDSLEQRGIGTGIIATKWLFPLLSRYGHVSLGLRLAAGSAFPSWGYMISQGATTIWEHWDAYHNPSGDSMSSHNHPAFTSIGAWFFTDLVGIRVDREPMELGPMLDFYDELLPQASGKLQTPSGLVGVMWQMRPYVSVGGVCPMSCMVRVPLDGLPIDQAIAILKANGADHVDPCVGAACVLVGAGAFELKLTRLNIIVI